MKSEQSGEQPGRTPSRHYFVVFCVLLLLVLGVATGVVVSTYHASRGPSPLATLEDEAPPATD